MFLNVIYMLMASKFIFLAQTGLLSSRPVYLIAYLASTIISEYSHTKLSLSFLFLPKLGHIPGFPHSSEWPKHMFNLQTNNLEVIIDDSLYNNH